MKHRGFTIVELIAVIAIIGILLGIVTTAVSSSIKNARKRKTDAAISLLQQAFATYKAQKGNWPGFSDTISGTTPKEGNEKDNTDYVEISDSDVRKMIKAIVDESRKGNPLMDISGLFVATESGTRGSRVQGMDILDALRGTRKNKAGTSIDQLYYGYPEESKGYFRNFRVLYSFPTDSVKVSRMYNDAEGL